MKLCLNMKMEEIVLDDIEEFVTGYEFFYVKLKNSTVSFPRSSILNVERIYPDTTRKKVHLKQIPKDRKGDIFDHSTESFE